MWPFVRAYTHMYIKRGVTVNACWRDAAWV